MSKKKTNIWANPVLEHFKLGNKDPEALTQLAKDIAANLVFIDKMIRPGDESLTGMIFMPLMMGAFAEFTPESVRDTVGMVYEYYDKALPRGINGYPIFMSMALINKHDFDIVKCKVIKIQELMKSI